MRRMRIHIGWGTTKVEYRCVNAQPIVTRGPVSSSVRESTRTGFGRDRVGIINGVVAIAATIGVAIAVSGDAHAQATAKSGIGTAGPAQIVNFSQLPTVTGPLTPHVIPAPGIPIPAAQLKALKDRAARPQGGPSEGSSPALAPRSMGEETPGVFAAFNGDNQTESACQDVTPADGAIAVGDGAHPILELFNECVSVWSTSGARLSGPVYFGTFFGSTAGNAVFDPRALYDWTNNRYIATAVEVSGSTGFYDIAVSQTDNPAGNWFRYRLQVPSHTNAFNDFTRLGQDHTATYPISSGTAYPGAIYLASNLFPVTGGAGFISEEWLILPKSAMYNGQGFSFWFFSNLVSPDGTTSFSSQPANVFSPFDIPRAEFFLASACCGGNAGGDSPTGSSNTLVAWAVSNPFGWVSGGPTPELSAVEFNTVNHYGPPPNATQTGTSTTIDTNDARISGEVTYGSGFLYGALTSSNTSGASDVIMYKVRPTLNTNDARCTGNFLNACPQITAASINNETVLDYGSNFAFFGTPQPDPEGNVTMVFGFSGPAFHPGLAYISQRVTGSFVDFGYFLNTGAAVYLQGRWGDYTAVAPVLVEPAWTAFTGMWANGGNCFGTGTGCWFTETGISGFSAATQP